MTVFIDVNVIMYAAGGSHPHQAPSQRLLEGVLQGRVEAISDTEILQELLYRFWRLNKVELGAQLVRQVVEILPNLLPVESRDGVLAAALLNQHPVIEPRDAIHAAVMLNHGLTRLYSYDHHFDHIPGLTRLVPK
ncbi:MAG: type II toxin-antitoxin system VapC family toxin [Candidatus Omnitrophota bacterium]|nr:type II toxin-antitoxin system VapC family toxin [Candidatus Omnitrophota bacterium]